MNTHNGNIYIDPPKTICGKGKGSNHKVVGSCLMNEVEEDGCPFMHADLRNANITDVDQHQTTQSNDSNENIQVQEISSSNTTRGLLQTREECDNCPEKDQETQLKMESSGAAEGSTTNYNQMEDADKIGLEKLRETKYLTPADFLEIEDESTTDMEAKLEEKNREISQLRDEKNRETARLNDIIMQLKKELDEIKQSTNEETVINLGKDQVTYFEHEESTTHSEVITFSNPAMELAKPDKENGISQEDHNETQSKTVSCSVANDAKTNNDSLKDSLQIDSGVRKPSAEISETTTLSDSRSTLEESITNRDASSEAAVSSNVYQIDNCSSVVIGTGNKLTINTNHFRNGYEAMTIAKLELEREKEITKQKETEVKKLEAAKELFSLELFKDPTKLEQAREILEILSMTPADATKGSIILHLVTSDPKIFLEKDLGEIEQQLSEVFSKCLITQEMKAAVDFAELRVKTSITSVLFQRQGLEKLKETSAKYTTSTHVPYNVTESETCMKCAELEAELEEKNKEISQLRKERQLSRLHEEKGELAHQGDSKMQLRKELDQEQKSDTQKPLLEEYKECIEDLAFTLEDLLERIEKRPDMLSAVGRYQCIKSAKCIKQVLPSSDIRAMLSRIAYFTFKLRRSSSVDKIRDIKEQLQHLGDEMSARRRRFPLTDKFVSFELLKKIAEDLCSGKGKHAEKLFDYLKSEDKLSAVMIRILPIEKEKLTDSLRILGREDLISEYIELAEGDPIRRKTFIPEILKPFEDALDSETMEFLKIIDRDPKKLIKVQTVIKPPVHDDSELGQMSTGDDSMTDSKKTIEGETVIKPLEHGHSELGDDSMKH